MKKTYMVSGGFANRGTGFLDNPSFLEFQSFEMAWRAYAEEVEAARGWWAVENSCKPRGCYPGSYIVELSYCEFDDEGDLEHSEDIESYEYSKINYDIEKACGTHDYELIADVYRKIGPWVPSLREIWDDVRFGYLGAIDDGKRLVYDDGSAQAAVYIDEEAGEC